MKLVRWSRKGEAGAPLHPLEIFHRQMDRLFGDWPPATRGTGSFVPRLDVSETDKEVLVTAELPGLDEKDVEVTFSEGCLLIGGEKKSEREEKEGAYHLVERNEGSFSRVVELGSAVDPEKAEASYKNGVLTVKVPKKEDSKPKRIDIKSS